MREGLPRSLDPAALTQALPRFPHYFRYPLHASDFHPLRGGDAGVASLLGYYSAKPLYGTLDKRGRVDRSSGFSGEIAAVFVPSPARSWNRARLLQIRMPRDQVRNASGQRNWPAINHAAEIAIRHSLSIPTR